MANGDTQKKYKHMTFAKYGVPLVGALIDYMDSSIEYLWKRTFSRVEKLHVKSSRTRVSATFSALLCLMLGFLANVKMEVITFDEQPLPNDLHFVLMSKDDNIYIDDIDVSRKHLFIRPWIDRNTATYFEDGETKYFIGVMCCIEASDCLVLLISCLLVWNSSNLKSPLSEYLFLPWLGMTLRGLILRQVPTVTALVYTMAIVEGSVNRLFLTAFIFLFLLESRMCLEMTRVMRVRWERREHAAAVDGSSHYEIETLWSNDDVQSVEVRNYVY